MCWLSNRLRTDPAQLANVVPLDQLATDLATAQTTPAFGWITPSCFTTCRTAPSRKATPQPLLASADYRTRLGSGPADGQRCRRHVMSDFFPGVPAVTVA